MRRDGKLKRIVGDVDKTVFYFSVICGNHMENEWMLL